MNAYKLSKQEQAKWIHGEQEKKLTNGDALFMVMGVIGLVVLGCVL